MSEGQAQTRRGGREAYLFGAGATPKGSPVECLLYIPRATRLGRRVRLLGLVCCGSLLLFFLGGCATHTTLACPAAKGRTTKVYFATDRQAKGSEPRLQFAPHRSDPPTLQVGWEEVSLGAKHAVGKLDPAVAITAVHSGKQVPGGQRGEALRRSDAVIAAFANGTLRAAIRASQPPRSNQPRQVLLFIHGFNNSFDESLRKAAQLAADLDLVDCAGRSRGVPIAYSWPAEGTVLSYLADEENAEWTQQRLVPFLRAVADVCRQERAELHIVAHSMGSRALIRSLADIANAGGPGMSQPIGHVILLAPDMGKALFDQYLQRVLPLVQHLTIYVSARDRALSLSRILHGGHERLGLIESTIMTALNLTGLSGSSHRELGASPEAQESGKVDMIDVSSGIAGSFGHSYEDPSFIRDLHELIANDTPAGTGARQNLQARETSTDLFHSLGRGRVRFFQLKAGK